MNYVLVIQHLQQLVEPLIVGPPNKGYNRNNLSIKEVPNVHFLIVHFQPPEDKMTGPNVLRVLYSTVPPACSS